AAEKKKAAAASMAAETALPQPPQDVKIEEPPKWKKCSKCGVFKPLDSFYNSRASKDGRGHYCMSCQSLTINALNRKKALEKIIDNYPDVDAVIAKEIVESLLDGFSTRSLIIELNKRGFIISQR
ncbi:MAG: hypothetical protein FWH53_11270, partial [Leptospirales bacterium]|nr:hypothetical protein [Leptospirales bacterium]